LPAVTGELCLPGWLTYLARWAGVADVVAAAENGLLLQFRDRIQWEADLSHIGVHGLW